MSYCDYNPRLFKEFTSMKTKIVPKFSSTWKLKAESYNKKESCILKNDEGVSIADISIKRLLQFFKEQKVTMIGDEIQGNFIIGNDRSLYTEEMFNTWKEKFDKRVETLIETKNLVEGRMYKTVCGSTFLYLGKRFVITGSPDSNGNLKVSNGTWADFCVAYFNPNETSRWAKTGANASRLNQKAVEDQGEYSGFAKFAKWESEYIANASSFRSTTAPLYVEKDRAKLEELLPVFEFSHYKATSVSEYYPSVIKNECGQPVCVCFGREYGWSSSRNTYMFKNTKPVEFDPKDKLIRNISVNTQYVPKVPYESVDPKTEFGFFRLVKIS